MSIKSQKDFASGLMFTVTGAAFAWNSATGYTVGTAGQMGPGYFPLMISMLLAALGLIMVVLSFGRRNEPIEIAPLRSIAPSKYPTNLTSRWDTKPTARRRASGFWSS